MRRTPISYLRRISSLPHEVEMVCGVIIHLEPHSRIDVLPLRINDVLSSRRVVGIDEVVVLVYKVLLALELTSRLIVVLWLLLRSKISQLVTTVTIARLTIGLDCR